MATVYDRVLAAIRGGRAVTAETVGTDNTEIVSAWQRWDGQGIPPMVNEPNQDSVDTEQIQRLLDSLK